MTLWPFSALLGIHQFSTNDLFNILWTWDTMWFFLPLPTPC
jgi:hypothetical protein